MVLCLSEEAWPIMPASYCEGGVAVARRKLRLIRLSITCEGGVASVPVNYSERVWLL